MVNTEQQEIWKTCPEYPWIEASNLGRVRTKSRVVTGKDGKKYHVKGHILKQHFNPYRGGYLYLSFQVNGKTIHRYVHQIIAITFIPNPHGYLEVNHKDNNPKNNAVSNLEWCTSQYNVAYREKYGVSAAKAVGQSVLVVNSEIGEVLWFKTQAEAARQLGVDARYVNNVIKGRQKTAGGCWFCRVDENAIEKARAKFGDDIANKVEKLMNEHRN